MDACDFLVFRSRFVNEFLEARKVTFRLIIIYYKRNLNILLTDSRRILNSLYDLLYSGHASLRLVWPQCPDSRPHINNHNLILFLLVTEDGKKIIAPAKTMECAKNWLQERSKKTFNKKTLHKRLPILKWLPSYNADDAVGDLVAGITVGLTVIPQALAYSGIAGLPAAVRFFFSVAFQTLVFMWYFSFFSSMVFMVPFWVALFTYFWAVVKMCQWGLRLLWPC